MLILVMILSGYYLSLGSPDCTVKTQKSTQTSKLQQKRVKIEKNKKPSAFLLSSGFL